jgi:imidazolonepropionase-like amidohydrolase
MRMPRQHGTRVDKETLALMEKKGVFLVPTAGAILGHYEFAAPAQRALMEDSVKNLLEEIVNARAAHVKIVSNSDVSNDTTRGRNAFELITLVKLGFTPSGYCSTAVPRSVDTLD